ncbi:inositol monophosphatase [Verrucomicrobia bacterium]|nr:inositol monophosphatase [Verrucomicrobiota bacterium]
MDHQLNQKELNKALAVAQEAAQAAGKLMSQNLRKTKKRQEESQHDIKLELDVRCQKVIEKVLKDYRPSIPVLGEEGFTGDVNEPVRWIVDPIDGTVNYTYGLPHACVSIALQGVSIKAGKRKSKPETILGVVYDPFLDEMWAAVRDKPARMNGRLIQPNKHKKLEESVLAIGFSKSKGALDEMLPAFNSLVYRVRKVRILGAAALSLAWIADGRLDAFMEKGVRIWDIVAGGFILEQAGGDFYHQAIDDEHRYSMIANNGCLRRKLQPFMPKHKS